MPTTNFIANKLGILRNLADGTYNYIKTNVQNIRGNLPEQSVLLNLASLEEQVENLRKNVHVPYAAYQQLEARDGTLEKLVTDFEVASKDPAKSETDKTQMAGEIEARFLKQVLVLHLYISGYNEISKSWDKLMTNGKNTLVNASSDLMEDFATFSLHMLQQLDIRNKLKNEFTESESLHNKAIEIKNSLRL